MKARVEYGNPYRDDLLRAAFRNGKRERLLGRPLHRWPHVSERTWHAHAAGFHAWGWHRSPSGRVKWHRDVAGQ